MSTFLDRFHPDSEFADSRRIWDTAKPLLVDAIVEFAPYDPDYRKAKVGKRKPYPLEPSSPSGKVANDQVAVVVETLDNDFAPLQQSGWEYLIQHAPAVEQALVKKLRSVHKKNLNQFLEEELPDAQFLQAPWERIQSELKSPIEDAIDRFFKLVGISLSTEGLDECCFVGFEFQTGWDQDHGLEILMHKDRVLAAGGMSELIWSDGSTVERIRAIQEYDLDPDDFKL